MQRLVKRAVGRYNAAVKRALSKNNRTKSRGILEVKRCIKQAELLSYNARATAQDRNVLRSLVRTGKALLKKIDKPINLTPFMRAAQRIASQRQRLMPVISPRVAQQAFATEMRPVAQAAIEANNAAVISTSSEAAAAQADDAASALIAPEATEASDATAAAEDSREGEGEGATLFEKLWPTDKPIYKRPALYVAGAIVLIGALAMGGSSEGGEK